MMETMRFGPLLVRFDRRVLRPRPWTLAQPRWAAELFDDLPAGPILELCSGVGHLGLVLASLVERDLVQVDADARACAYARRNAVAAGLPVRVDVRHAPIDGGLAGDERFAFVLADPPWVPSDETVRYPGDPVHAIDGGADGLAPARACVEVTGHHLLSGGMSILQLRDGHQAARIADHVDRRPELGLRVADSRTVDGANGVLVRLVSDRSVPSDTR
jgi:methylase of polypeptide subunit release factors